MVYLPAVRRPWMTFWALSLAFFLCGPVVGEEDPASALRSFYHRHRDVRYGFGNCSEHRMDCSCLVRKLFAELFDLDLSRDTLRQARELRFLRVQELGRSDQLRREDLCPGDLIYTFSGPSWEAGPRHVAVYAGSGEVLHSAVSLDGVGLSAVSWLHQFRLKGVYRPLGC